MSVLRITGIASGLDTEQVVRDLMRIERLKVDRLYQERQTIQWRKEQFREIINRVRSFRDTYFDILKPETNLMSASALHKMQVSSSDSGILTAVASSGALSGTRTVEILQLATEAKGTSTAPVTAPIQSSADITEPVTVTEGKNVIRISLNGQTKEITVAEGTYTLDELKSELQAKIDSAFGTGKIDVSSSGNRLQFAVSPLDTLSLSSNTYYAGGVADEEDVLAVLNLQTGASNRLSLSSTMEEVSAKLAGGSLVFDGEGKFVVTINDVAIEIDRSDTLSQVLSKINNSAAGVTMTYSSFSDTFTLKSKATGEGTITFDAGGNLFAAFNIDSVEAGRDLQFTVDGSAVASRSGNTFTADGVTYTAKATGTATVTVNIDTEGIYTLIESFVNDYNSLIETINSKLKEEYFRDFPPLTDEQKKEMSESEIELWEEKAKSGLLRRDPLLEGLLMEMRRALYDAVGETHLTEIGIETSNNYRDNGKLVLKGSGSTLKAALAEDPEKIIELFARTSDIAYSPNLTAAERAGRYAESGLAHRLSDILNDNIRTTRDSSGCKGALLERAGIAGDISEFDNYYDRQILDVNESIDRLNEMLTRKEEQLYLKFAAMEKALQQLYSQSDWLIMQMSMLNAK
jgi:flagellar hook-associated protein 2